MNLSMFVSESGMAEFERIRAQKRDLIAQMPNLKLRNILNKNSDLPIDKLAEIYTAMAKDYIVCDGHGYDFTTRSGRVKRECKFATLTEYIKTSEYVKKDGTVTTYNTPVRTATVSNLHSKNCDLVIMIDMGGYLKYYELPVGVWKTKWKSNTASLTFGSRNKWWEKYEMSKEKFFSGESIWL